MMKILFVNPAPIIKYGIGKAFAEQGHEIFFVTLAAENSLKPFLDDIRPQYVFTENGTGLFKKLFPLLEHREIPHIYWAIEDPVDFQQLSLPYARKSAWTFTPCRESIADYRKYRIEAHLLMFACLPSFHRHYPSENRYKHDIVFVGNNYARHPARLNGMNNILRPLMDRAYNIKIYGNEWWLNPDYPFNIETQYYGGYLPNEEFPILCSSAAINLGLHSVDTSTTMMSMRTFEVLGCGGFYLSQWTPAIERLFKNHYHLVWTKSAEETIELVNFYLAHPEERRKIALRGQREVYNKHSYHHRVEDMVKILKEPIHFPKKRANTSARIKISPGKKIILPHNPL